MRGDMVVYAPRSLVFVRLKGLVRVHVQWVLVLWGCGLEADLEADVRTAAYVDLGHVAREEGCLRPCTDLLPLTGAGVMPRANMGLRSNPLLRHFPNVHRVILVSTNLLQRRPMVEVVCAAV